MNLLRLLFARLMHWIDRQQLRGRYADWQPWVCLVCGHVAPLRWFMHTYEDDGSCEDVSGIDECPHCTSNFTVPVADALAFTTCEIPAWLRSGVGRWLAGGVH